MKRVNSYVVQALNSKGLVKGKDFKVVSKVVVTQSFDAYTLEGFNKSGLSESTILETSNTPLPDTKDFTFYLINEDVDVSLATECSLGVVKLLTGEHAGKFAVYFVLKGTDDEWDEIDEVIALGMYLQLKYPNIDMGLSKIYDEHMDLIESLFILNTNKYIATLEKLFN